MDYNFIEIEKKWQDNWKKNKTFKVNNNSQKPKFYVLDMFPYPSGAGLHVGHPLGYIASDIYTRYKNLTGFNVLHPMGFDAFGLPAEQYAIQTGQHPAITTDNNIKRYKEQLEKIGFAYDWDREFRTSEPSYYKWTQWVFIKLFNHWYNNKSQKAESIETLIELFNNSGNITVDAANNCEITFSAEEWQHKTENEKQKILLCYRLAYLAKTMVNWCPALGTVLANDEVKEGLSVRGGHPVEQRKMMQWCLRITAYAERLLNGLDNLKWTDSLKEMQRNWIGKSVGAEINFTINNEQKTSNKEQLTVFTTRPDTIFGCTFMVLAPEHELVTNITTPEQKSAIEEYVTKTKKRTERERMTEVNKVSGCFTGAFAIHPFTKLPIPVWISDYVLAGYGTGAIMAVPAHDSRDFAFARYFNLPIIQVIKKHNEEPTETSTWTESFDAKEGTCINSDFINGLQVVDAINKIISKIEEIGIGKRMINYRLRDAIFSRQRYWGEPFPIYYKDELPYPLPENELPLELPEIDSFLPTPDGQPPLSRAANWKTKDGFPLELSTMPGFAGSSGYYFRYMDPTNNNEFVSKDAVNYWKDVDLYIGGTEHATGHLIYSRFWCKFLHDIEIAPVEEPFKKLINQGMILGMSEKIYREGKKVDDKSIEEFSNTINLYDINLGIIKNSVSISETAVPIFISADLYEKYIINSKIRKYYPINIDIDHVSNSNLNFDSFLQDSKYYELKDAVFITNDGGFWKSGIYYNSNGEISTTTSSSFKTKQEVEKMSKSKYNVVNPDTIVEKYGADTLRMYEMFLGPLEQAKPWDTAGIEGVHRFLRKFWKLYHDEKNSFNISDEKPTSQELKILHKLIKKVQDDIEQFSFNTSVSAFMICINELTDLKCNKRQILEPLVIVLSPFAPHIAEEIWQLLGNKESILRASYPIFNESLVKENSKMYPVSFNGKVRFQLELSISLTASEIEKIAVENEQTQKWLDGKQPKKIIVVPQKIINIVL